MTDATKKPESQHRAAARDSNLRELYESRVKADEISNISDEDRTASFESESFHDGEVVKNDDVDDKKEEKKSKKKSAKIKEKDKEKDAPEEDEDDQEVEEDESEPEDDQEEDEPEPEDDQEEDEEDETDKEEPKKKGNKSFTRRINELTRDKRDALRAKAGAEEEAARLRAEIADLKAGKKPAETKAASDDVEIDTSDLKEPDPKDYDYGELDSKYVNDVADYRAELKLRKFQAREEEKRRSDAARREGEEAQKKLSEIEERGFEKYEDFAEKVEKLTSDGIALSPELARLIIDSDVGEDVVYHLASNPKEAKRISQLTPAKQGVEFARLEARFQADDDGDEDADDAAKEAKGKQPEKRTVATKAPEPPKTKVRGSGGKFGVRADSDDFEALQSAFREGKIGR